MFCHQHLVLSLNQCHGDSWFLSRGREFFISISGFGFLFVFWVYIPNIKGMFGKDPRTLPPLVVVNLSPLSLFFFFFFLFCFGFCWFGSWLVQGLGFLMVMGLVIFYLGLKGGVQVWLFADLWSYGCFLIWGLSQNGSNMVFLLVYAYEFVYVW